MRRNPVILQISDLHFGTSVKPFQWGRRSDNTDARMALEEAVLGIDPRPDFLVATGDLANGGRIAELQDAKSYLHGLLDKLWAQGQPTRCIVIPGNHDVWQTTAMCPSGYTGRVDRLREFREVFGSGSFVSKTVPEDQTAYITPYSPSQYYELHGGPGGGPASSADAGGMAEKALQVCEFFPAFQVAFLTLDSNIRLNRWKPAHISRGLVGLTQRHMVNGIIRDYESATENDPAPFADARRVAVVHHHLTRLPNVKLENWMLMDDAGEVARWLARNGIRLVLHGHFHTADLIGLTYWNTELQGSKVNTIVVSAGSATSLDRDDGHNSCHYVHLEHFRTRIWRPFLDNGEYQPLAVAASFEFPHEPDLSFSDATAGAYPIFLEALQTSMAGSEKLADIAHTYEAVESEGYVDADRNYFGCVTLKGTNVTGRPTKEIPFTFTAVGSQYFEEFECRAMGLDDNRPWKVEPAEQRPIQLFPCRDYFPEPLPPGGNFHVRITFKLAKVMFDENDFDMLSLLRFPRGVAFARMCLLSEKHITAPSLLEVRGSKLIESNAPFPRVDKTPEYPGFTNSVTGYEARLNSPAAHSYLIFYRKLEAA